jgi:cytochrome c biogenesis protein CcmG/thiol:disulfide interchange protein DsbE
MDTYYTLLDIPTQATAEEVESAYRRQRERYSPERVAMLDEEFRRVAEARTAELEQAYAVLADPRRREEYDRSIGTAAGTRTPAPRQAGLSRRELAMAAGGALVGLLVIALVWVWSGQTAEPGLPPVAKISKPAPDAVLTSLTGGELRLSDYRGKVVLVNFWYTGCEPCREETPALQAAYQKLADQGLVILGVNVRGNERRGPEGVADVKSFVERYSVTYPIGFDEQGEVERAFQVYVLPTSFMIDQSGMIQYASFSAITMEDVERLFKELQQDTTALR